MISTPNSTACMCRNVRIVNANSCEAQVEKIIEIHEVRMMLNCFEFLEII